MQAPIYLSDTALPRGSSGLPPNPGFPQVNAEAPPLGKGALRYVCSQCNTSYAQRQGYSLHVRTVHNPKSCFLCDFKWGRPYEYRNHLLKNHPDVDPDVILGKPAGSRRRATILTDALPQLPPVSLPAVGQDQRRRARFQPNPSAPPFSAPAGYTSVSPPVYAEQTVTMGEHKYALGSGFLDPTHPLRMLLPTVEHSEPMNDIFLQDPGLPSAHPSGSTAMYGPSNPETAAMHFSPFSDADIDVAFNSIFTDIP